MSSRFFATRAAVAAVYIIGFVILTGVGIWDITNIVTDYTSDNRLTTVKSVNITDSFPFLHSNVRICFDYPNQAIYPQRLAWSDSFPILRAGWKGSQLNNLSLDTSESACTWERTLRAAVPHFYMYYVIGDIDNYGPDLDANYSARNFANEEFVNATGINKTELYSIIDSYIDNPEKLLLMKQSLYILRYFMGGLVPKAYAEITAGIRKFSAVIMVLSSPIAQERCCSGCILIKCCRRKTLESRTRTF